MATIKRIKLVLLDTHAVIHRAYHALPDFASSTGEPTGALYGLATMLMKIIADVSPDYIIACYDLPQKTFRHEVYKEYKAGRAKADDALIAQLKSSRAIFEALNIPIYDCPGFEADDMLGTIVSQVTTDKKLTDVDVVIASGDMDTLQLVSGKRVQVFTLKKGITDTIVYDQDGVTTRFGFVPKLLPDYKGLRGDPSDNIIGIAGIGEKTATTLITTFGTIEDIYKQLKNPKTKTKFKDAGITDRIIKLLEDGEEEALFSKTLATIRHDAPTVFTLPEKNWRDGIVPEQVLNLFRMLEFKSLIGRFEKVLGKSLNDSASPELAEEKEIVDPHDIQKIGLALWLLDSEKTTPTLEDILGFARARDFATARDYILKEIKEKKLSYMYEQVELPIMNIVHEMQENGVLLDVEYLKKLSYEYHTELDKIAKRIHG